MHNTSNCCHYDKVSKPLGTTAGKPSEGKKLYKKYGSSRNLAYMTAMFEAFQKGQKKTGLSKKCKNSYDFNSNFDSE